MIELPQYKPDGSLPDLPSEPVTGQDLEQRYGISKAAFHKRRAVVPSVAGVRQGRFVYFPPDQVFVLDAVHFYITQGFSLEDVARAHAKGQTNIDPTGSVDVESSAPQVGELATVSPSMADFSNQMACHISEAIKKFQPPSDPLRPFKLLGEAADNKYTITSKMLANILELKMSSVHSLDAEIERHGFLITKAGPGKWRVHQIEEEMAA